MQKPIDPGQRIPRAEWPTLPARTWPETRATLHMWTQIVGKLRLALSPPQNHFWHSTLYLTARGLTTSPLPYRGEVRCWRNGRPACARSRAALSRPSPDLGQHEPHQTEKPDWHAGTRPCANWYAHELHSGVRYARREARRRPDCPARVRQAAEKRIDNGREGIPGRPTS